ncbi:hypothetical protein LG200_11925 [Methylobacillus caricis]|uniref:hypothetical protein n=1 Tax=Methylobacillus caricis TaxID=1971611 RepID=UPI001CFFF89E|nr:hypothetical protein [Methylobacillus caricis]MCB5188707.1 hypothetical protein [Methylobacillus caricis]
MRFEIDYLQEHHVSLLTVSGAMKLDEYRTMVVEILADMQRHQTNNLIVDLRNVTLGLSFNETSRLPEINRELGVNTGHKVAIVFMEHSPKANGVRLYEILAAHRGYDHKLFTRHTAGLLWFINCETAPVQAAAQ